jgi:hypothetical protein
VLAGGLGEQFVGQDLQVDRDVGTSAEAALLMLSPPPLTGWHD